MIRYTRNLGEISEQIECDTLAELDGAIGIISKLNSMDDKAPIPDKAESSSYSEFNSGFKVTINDIISVESLDNGLVQLKRLDGHVMTFHQEDVTIE